MTGPVLSVRDLAVRFNTTRGKVSAVDGVDLDLQPREVLSIVGESGCGKSTLGRAIMRLVDLAAGSIKIDGVEIAEKSRRQMKPYRKNLQMVFQDPFSSLDPRWTVGRLIAEPLKLNTSTRGAALTEKVADLLSSVGLNPDAASRYPHEFSGGQRQRIGIARALALDPKVIICDEPVSALDVSVQAQILNRIADIRKSRDLSLLFISHDLSVVEYLSDRIAVMYLGKIVEIASREKLFGGAAHPYTRALLDAVPTIGRKADPGSRIQSIGEIPSPFDPPSGCRYHPRCPKATDICHQISPALDQLTDPDHRVACHHPIRQDEATGLTFA